MASHVHDNPRRDIPTRWLTGIIAGALGLGAAGCAERVIVGDDFGGFGDDTGTLDSADESSDSGTSTPTEPFECPNDNVIVPGPIAGDGTCGACDDACMDAAWAKVEMDYWCDGSCSCDVVLVCSATLPNEDGQCLHGFYVEEFCGEGRPLIADGELRVAPSCAREDWLCAVPRPQPVTGSLREQVVEGWLARAAMEHASVAAFARFGAQLQGLGAPARLVRGAQVAGHDELRHALLCYAYASQLAGRSLGPGPLDIRGLDLDLDPARVAWESIVEGCIGETIAAAKMRYLAGQAADPETRALLEAIAEDEARHAALAWQALRWMLGRFAIAKVARETFAAALADARLDGGGPGDGLLERHGVLDEQTSAWITATVLREVIAPAVVQLGLEPRSHVAA